MFIAPPAVRAVITDFIFTGLAFIFVLLRLGTRAFMIKSVGAEDYLILGAMVSSYISSVILPEARHISPSLQSPESGRRDLLSTMLHIWISGGDDEGRSDPVVTGI